MDGQHTLLSRQVCRLVNKGRYNRSSRRKNIARNVSFSLFFFFPNKRMRFLFSFLVKTAAATAAMAATAESEIFITVVRNAVKN